MCQCHPCHVQLLTRPGAAATASASVCMTTTDSTQFGVRLLSAPQKLSYKARSVCCISVLSRMRRLDAVDAALLHCCTAALLLFVHTRHGKRTLTIALPALVLCSCFIPCPLPLAPWQSRDGACARRACLSVCMAGGPSVTDQLLGPALVTGYSGYRAGAGYGPAGLPHGKLNGPTTIHSLAADLPTRFGPPPMHWPSDGGLHFESSCHSAESLITVAGTVILADLGNRAATAR
jgi:hypothetical protein